MAKKQSKELPSGERELLRELTKVHDGQAALAAKKKELDAREGKIKEALSRIWEGRKGGEGRPPSA